jgi:hypothetical protein
VEAGGGTYGTEGIDDKAGGGAYGTEIPEADGGAEPETGNCEEGGAAWTVTV